MSAGTLHAVGELSLVYIPIYDRLQLGTGLVAILEILLPVNVSESMLLANMISYVSTVMDTLNVCPHPLRDNFPLARSNIAGPEHATLLICGHGV